MKIEKLLDVVQIKNPKPEKFSGEKRYYSTGNINEHDVSENFELIKFENRPSRANVQPIENSVGFAKMKSTAKTLLVTKNHSDCIFSTGMNFLQPSERIISKYLYYYLISPYFFDLKDKYSGQGIMGGLSNKDLNLFYIPIPPLQEQGKIVKKLDKVFENIDNTLKNLKNKNAQSLDLYESILKNTFLNIDSDHEPIENFCNEIFAGGDRPKEISKTPDEIFKYKIFSNGITNNGLYGFSSKYRVKDKALTISARGTIGHLEIRKEPFTPIIRLITIVPNDILHLDFLYHFLKYSLNLKTGSVIPQLTVPMIKKIQLPKLSMHNQKKISELLNDVLLKSIDLRMIINKQENLFDDFKKSILNKEFSYE